MKSTIIILFLSFLFIMTSCTSPRKGFLNDLDGIYVSESNKDIQLILEGNTFLQINKELIKDLAIYKCCDTISFGKIDYLTKDSLIAFTTSEDFNSEFINFDVQEYEDVNQDSIKFLFSNPIENHYGKFNESYRELLYSVQILNDNFQNIISDKNPISIVSENEMKEFQIKIYPKYDIPLNHIEVREVKLKPYKVINYKANIFKINISQLNYGYLSFRRLNGDYVRVVNKNKLIWDGNVYMKIW